ncbi:helix-turn-helix domain-containing protein [Amycolatopsis sp. NPDC059021]|uniref:helix-turn-helix domain-containing protein n=1 Tax=Amycolatopsis sp. NPDC059021 TaxID=3346704 RepID=UPI0036713A6B
MNYAETDRDRLASALLALRKAAGLSTTELARRLGCSQSKISKTERGRTLPDADFVTEWANATGADADVRQELVSIARQAGYEAVELKRDLAPGRRRKQEEIGRLESSASVVRVFAPALVVGLAQSRAYVEAVFRLGRDSGVAENLDEIVQERLNRQAVLDDEAKRFELLVSEFALRRQLVSEDEMRSQLKKLVELSRRSNVSFGVIPFAADEQVHQYHGFSILGDPTIDDEALVLVTTVTRTLRIRAPTEVADYITHFDALRSGALVDADFRAYVEDVIAAT